MKTPANVLLLDWDGTCGRLSESLRGILETVSGLNLRLEQEAIETGQSSRDWAGTLRSMVSRVRPAMIYLISPWEKLKSAGTLFKTLQIEPPHPPLVGVFASESAADQTEINEAIHFGLDDFITAPLRPVEIELRLRKSLEQTCHGATLSPFPHDNFARPLIGQSPAFIAAIRQLPTIAQSSATVLISGETGTGKEVCARAIHKFSNRAAGNFVAVNCAEMHEQLVESELFGHERGAFTGAVGSKLGLVGAAEGGTLFLDELNSLDPRVQASLLRFLQEKEYRPVGSTKTKSADVRVIAATNEKLEEAVENGKIRRDLYYRLNTFPIHLPPLRERPEDIRMLAAHFQARTANELRKNVNGFTPGALAKLCLYDWPGNVRELESIITRAVTLTDRSIVHDHDLTLNDSAPKPYQLRKEEMIRDWEKRQVKALLVAYDGNICHAADAAGKDRRAFFELIRKLKIDPNEYRPHPDRVEED
jgi:DNA-binding NtrC family response regulator